MTYIYFIPSALMKMGFTLGDKQVIIPTHAPCDKLHAYKRTKAKKWPGVMSSVKFSHLWREFSVSATAEEIQPPSGKWSSYTRLGLGPRKNLSVLSDHLRG